MKFTPTTLRMQLSGMLLAAAVLSGCQQALDQAQINKQFQPDDEPRSVNNYFNAQTAIGAREDGMLYTCHFTDGKLNSLGQAKLKMITSGAETGKLAIYLNLPQDGMYDKEQASVTDYLAKAGVATDHYTLTAGANPAGGTPAVQGLNGLAKQETTDGAGSSSGGSSASASASH